MVYTDINPRSHVSTAKLGATEHCWAAQLDSFDIYSTSNTGLVEATKMQMHFSRHLNI